MSSCKSYRHISVNNNVLLDRGKAPHAPDREKCCIYGPVLAAPKVGAQAGNVIAGRRAAATTLTAPGHPDLKARG
jgi:hypothetical protein